MNAQRCNWIMIEIQKNQVLLSAGGIYPLLSTHTLSQFAFQSCQRFLSKRNDETCFFFDKDIFFMKEKTKADFFPIFIKNKGNHRT